MVVLPGHLSSQGGPVQGPKATEQGLALVDVGLEKLSGELLIAGPLTPELLIDAMQLAGQVLRALRHAARPPPRLQLLVRRPGHRQSPQSA